MAHVLDDVLSTPEAEVLFKAALALPFEDGAKTAGRIARRVKDNLQAAPCAETDAVTGKLASALMQHAGFSALAYPKCFAQLIVSKTEGGGHYGDHVDNALMGGARSDLSFTLFLTPEGTYEGGALTISDGLEERQIKLGQGEMILYPSDTLHRVEPVTRGSRVVIVGWVTSFIRDPRQREVLFDLWRAIERAEAVEDTEQVSLLAKSRSNLIRLWAD